MTNVTYIMSILFFSVGVRCFLIDHINNPPTPSQERSVYHNRYMSLGLFAISAALYIAAYYHP